MPPPDPARRRPTKTPSAYVRALPFINRNPPEGHEQYGATSGADFAAVVVEAVRAINHGVFPERIAQGSSGSYFVKNMRGVRPLNSAALITRRRRSASSSRRTRSRTAT